MYPYTLSPGMTKNSPHPLCVAAFIIVGKIEPTLDFREDAPGVG